METNDTRVAPTSIFSALSAPFERGELRKRKLFRESKGDRGNNLVEYVTYVTVRTIMNRLDDVVGPENWWAEYTLAVYSVECRLTIRLPDGSTITKIDAGGINSDGEPGKNTKGGYSDALKRTAVQFGIGRYLYKNGVPRFAETEHDQSVIDVRRPYAEQAEAEAEREAPAPPRRPEPEPDRRPAEQTERRPERTDRREADGRDPRTGRAFFGWLKDRDAEHPGVMEHVGKWAKLNDLAGRRYVDWQESDVQAAVQEAKRRIASKQSRETAGVS